jgi:CYTH domain-containing protein
VNPPTAASRTLSRWPIRPRDRASPAGKLLIVLNHAAPPGKEFKYARAERERRFLLRAPSADGIVHTVRITDRYLLGTRLRLRRVTETSGAASASGRSDYKLTQKVPAPGGAPGLITTMSLDADEYAVLEQLPARVLHKTRISVPPLGIDVFEGALRGLVLGEAEFEDDAALASFVPPRSVVAEVTHDWRLSGGRLAVTTTPDIRTVLAEYGVLTTDR